MEQGIESKFGIVDDRSNSLIKTARESHEEDLDCGMCQNDLKALSALDNYVGYILNAFSRIINYCRR
ncbi:MAG TPA: hypothetical protein VJG30_04210 [Candidatus Nanoarchaeia archaeon]|nr:hypothetical protein [Candidatus Nanoarchaeia archaeon]